MDSNGISLVEAIDDFYLTSQAIGGTTSTGRLQKLARYCVQQLSSRGLPGAKTEVVIPGGGRPKQWDVAWRHHAKQRLAISPKSILRNIPGTVPNRLDDLMGEVANVQMYSPEIVLGYVMVFDVAQDALSRVHGCYWCDLLHSRLAGLSGRSAPAWSVGMIEAFVIVRVDFSRGPQVLTSEAEVHAMFDILATEVRKRNPSLDEGAER